MMYGALASGCAKQKSRLTWNQQYGETKLLKKLDWDMKDEPDLIWKNSALFGDPPHTGGLEQIAPVAPPCVLYVG